MEQKVHSSLPSSLYKCFPFPVLQNSISQKEIDFMSLYMSCKWMQQQFKPTYHDNCQNNLQSITKAECGMTKTK